MRLTKLFTEFFESEKAGGLFLIFCTALSLFLANSSIRDSYLNLWSYQFSGHDLQHWINDGLMTIFFLLIGLELEREIYSGELANFKTAMLPVLAALGGMLIPAVFYSLFNFGKATQPGAGIPIATDIAFAIGVLSLLGSRVPASLKIFLIALAIIDDLGAILTISLFYSSSLSVVNLAIALTVFIVLLILNRRKVYNLLPYIAGGIIMWYYMLGSGIHPTISGVMLAFTIPFKNGEAKSPSFLLQHFLHKPVAFFILPVFALANTCITIQSGWLENLTASHSLGIFTGLVFGKPIGILSFSLIAVATGLCTMPQELNWKHIAGAGILGGIGFTMSIFITLLAFNDPALINSSKIVILISSLVSGITGLLWLQFALKKTERKTVKE